MNIIDFGLRRDTREPCLSVLTCVCDNPRLGQYAFKAGRYVIHPDEPAPLFGCFAVAGAHGRLLTEPTMNQLR